MSRRMCQTTPQVGKDASLTSTTAREFFTKPRTVAFDLEHVITHSVDRVQDMSPQVVQATKWFSKEEPKAMEAIHILTLMRMEARIMPENENCCYRGLEQMTRQRVTRRRKEVCRSFEAVVQEQLRQEHHGWGCSDKEMLALVYQGYTAT
jgi:FtsZ-binding cell division protein ZapB